LDRYGFLVQSQYLKEFLLADKKYERIIEKQRSSWAQFRANNNVEVHIQHHTSDLLKVVKKGIPYDLRGEVSLISTKTNCSSFKKDILKIFWF
jgi:hypothetical protein